MKAKLMENQLQGKGFFARELLKLHGSKNCLLTRDYKCDNYRLCRGHALKTFQSCTCAICASVLISLWGQATLVARVCSIYGPWLVSNF